MRSLRIAEWSPTGRKVNDHKFASQICQRDSITFQGLQLKGRGCLAKFLAERFPVPDWSWEKQSGQTGIAEKVLCLRFVLSCFFSSV